MSDKKNSIQKAPQKTPQKPLQPANDRAKRNHDTSKSYIPPVGEIPPPKKK